MVCQKVFGQKQLIYLGLFLEYPAISKAYRVYNKRTEIVEETIHISFKEKKKDQDQNIHDLEKDLEDLSLNDRSLNQNSLQIVIIDDNPEPSIPHHVFYDIPKESEASSIKRRYTYVRDLRVVSQNQVIGDLSQGVRTISLFRTESNMGLISEIQPECIDKALQDQSWMEAMKEKLNQFQKSKVWTLVPLPKGHFVIGMRWVFRNKLNESRKVVRNIARLVAQGYNHQEGINYNETFAPIVRLETIKCCLHL